MIYEYISVQLTVQLRNVTLPILDNTIVCSSTTGYFFPTYTTFTINLVKKSNLLYSSTDRTTLCFFLFIRLFVHSISWRTGRHYGTENFIELFFILYKSATSSNWKSSMIRYLNQNGIFLPYIKTISLL